MPTDDGVDGRLLAALARCKWESEAELKKLVYKHATVKKEVLVHKLFNVQSQPQNRKGMSLQVNTAMDLLCDDENLRGEELSQIYCRACSISAFELYDCCGA